MRILHVLARLVTERLAHGHHAADVAVVVGAEHVNRHVGRVGLAVALVAVVGDVGGEVRVVAVGLDDHAVLVVTVLGGLEPGGAVLFEDVAAGAQVGDGLVDLAVGVQAVLMEPHVEVDAEVLHGLLNLVEHHRYGTLAEFLALLGIALAERFAVLVHATVDARQVQDVDAVGLGFVDDALGDLVDVGALVAVDRGFLAVGRGDERLGEAVDLLAVVVEVVFAHHLGAVGLKHAGHGIADGRPAGAADVDRAGRIGGYEFEVQGLAGQVVVLAVVAAGFEHGVHHCGRGCGVERDVDEAGAGHFHGLDAVGIGQFDGEQFGEITRLHAGLLGQLHGRVGRPIAVRAVLRAHHGELGLRWNQIGGQGACLAFGDKGVGNVENQFTKGFWTHSSKNTGHADRISLPVHPHDGVAIRPAERFARRSEHRPARHAVSHATPRTRNSPRNTARQTESCTAAWSAATGSQITRTSAPTHITIAAIGTNG